MSSAETSLRKQTSMTFRGMTLLSVMEVAFAIPFTGALLVLYYLSDLSLESLENFSGAANVIVVVLAAFVIWIYFAHFEPGIKSQVFHRNSPADPLTIFLATVVIFGIQFLQILPVTALEVLFNSLGYTFAYSAYSTTMQQLSWMDVVYAVFVATVIEEILYRGCALRSLMGVGRNFAIIVSSLIFSLAHADPNQFIFTFFTGMVLSAVCLKYSIFYSIFLHMMNNAFAILESYLSATFPGDWVYISFYTVILISAVFTCVLVYVKRYKIVAYLRNGRHLTDVRISYVLNNLWFYLFLIWQFILTSFNFSRLR